MAAAPGRASNLNHFVVPGLIISGPARARAASVASQRRRLSSAVYWNPMARRERYTTVVINVVTDDTPTIFAAPR